MLHNLVDIASKGGNYLLNVGPDGTGTIPPPEVDRLLQIGAWLKTNGKSIYGTKASPLAGLPDNERMTVRGDTYYLHVYSWNGNATLPGLVTDVKSARALVGDEKLAITKGSDGITNISPLRNSNSLDTVLELKLAGPLNVDTSVSMVKPNADGTIDLTPGLSLTTGGIQQEGSTPNDDLGYWFGLTDTAQWTLNLPADGNYTATLIYADHRGSTGAAFDLIASPTSKLSKTLTATTSWNNYTTINLSGTLHVTKGEQTITVVLTSRPGQAVMNLREIVLTPIDQ